MQKVDLPISFTKLNQNCGLPNLLTDYQIRHLGNPSGLPDILLKIDPWLNAFIINRRDTFTGHLLVTYTWCTHPSVNQDWDICNNPVCEVRDHQRIHVLCQCWIRQFVYETCTFPVDELSHLLTYPPLHFVVCRLGSWWVIALLLSN